MKITRIDSLTVSFMEYNSRVMCNKSFYSEINSLSVITLAALNKKVKKKNETNEL